MTRRHGIRVVVGAIAVMWLSAQSIKAQGAPTIYVGPNVRGKFVDMDAGIRDSIRDIKAQANQQGTSQRFRVVSSADEAMLTLFVLGRGRVEGGGSVVAPIGGMGFVIPNEKPTLTTLLKVGDYERIFQSEGGTWTAAAEAVIEDLVAWWQANRAALTQSNQ